MNEAEVNEYAARQLRMLRAAKGLSQTKLGKQVGMSPQQVQKYEWGINRLSAGKLMLFAEAFNMPVTEFFPKQDEHYSLEPVPPAAMRFMRLLSKINSRYYDQIYIVLQAVAKLSSGKLEV